MSRTKVLTFIGAFAVAQAGSAVPLITSAEATGYGTCSKAPRDQWKPIAQAEAAARAAGYEVRRAKIDGTCYEVYGTKGGSLFELYYDPATMKHVHTIKLR